jgi:RHS repeat-associated protein
MEYDSNTGGITGKSDAGTLLYENSEKPYALTGVDPSTGLVPEADQALTYTSFGSVRTISEDADSAVLVYNSDDERIKMMVLHNGSHEVTRWYSGSTFMKDSVSGTARSFTYIGGDAYSAQVVALKQGSTVSYYYLLRDHLGSITHVVNSTDNSVTAEYSYDSWGRMRNPQTWENYSPGSEPVLFSSRGFTGHEHLPWFNLVNMNGRVYDPLTGGFLSPDPYIQSPDITQNYNRFTYCLNNPLIYVDPSGYVKQPGRGPLWVAWHNFIHHFLPSLFDGNESSLSDAGGSNPSVYSYYSQWNNLDLGDGSNNIDGPQGQEGAMETVYSVANAINEFNPIANLWDVVSYALTGKDRFGNDMSLGKGMLKAAGVFPVGKIGNLAKAESLFTITNQSASKMNVVLNSGKASEFYKILNPAWNGTMPEVGYESFKAANGVRAWIYPAEMSNQGMATIKMMDRNGYLLIFRFADGF